MLKSDLLALPQWVKGTILAVLMGVAVTGGITVYVARQNAEAARLKDESNKLRGEAQEASRQAGVYKAEAVALKDALKSSMVNSAKIQESLDKIKVPPAPTKAPKYVGQIILDLEAMGIHPLSGASNTVGVSAFGIRKDETQIVWAWGKNSQRVPFLEQKLEKTNELVTAITNDRDVAIKLVDVKTKESSNLMIAASKYREESDTIRAEVLHMQKAMAGERKKKWLYAAGGVVATALTVKAFK